MVQQQRKFRLPLAALALLATLVGARAQEEAGPCDRPADKKLQKALAEALKEKDPGERHGRLKELSAAEPECTECLFQLGSSAYQRARSGAGRFEAGINYLEQVRARCPQYHADVDHMLGTMYYAEQRFPEAAQAFLRFQQFPGDDASRQATDAAAKQAEVERIMPELAFHANFYRNDRPLDPEPLAGVNGPGDEYLPMFSPDNELLFFTRMTRKQAKGDFVTSEIEELTESRRPDIKHAFDAGRPLPSPFNTGDGYGGVSVSVNNKELFVTICKRVSREYRNCDIYRAHYDTHMDFASGRQVFEWSEPQNLGPNVNTEDGWESQPSLSADGRTLYFATVRKGSRGTDIYESVRNEQGEWGVARPLAAPITTDGDEKAPFLHSDSRTLYFAARPPKAQDGTEDVQRGHRGIGGYDIFFSHLGDDGRWSMPQNIGHPINTPQDDHGLIVSADGRRAYFASNRFKGPGGLDIYGFDLPRDARPEDVLVVKGEVKDDAGKPVEDAEVTITYMDTRKTEVVKVDGTDGKYATVVRLKPGADVVMTVKKPDHVFDSRAFTVEDTVRGGVAEVAMQVAPIALGRSYRVNDINFATNSAEITPASAYILEEMVAFLKDNPRIRIEIQGHTDNVGNLADNMALSNDRALAVRTYLEAHGVAGGRLTSKGFGPGKPVADNATEEGRARNRRTEFVITGR
jgi:outer membrane protein OmpA-like peptidoglycan-associated protein